MAVQAVAQLAAVVPKSKRRTAIPHRGNLQSGGKSPQTSLILELEGARYLPGAFRRSSLVVFFCSNPAIRLRSASIERRLLCSCRTAE
jgi:hypothetical protein